MRLPYWGLVCECTWRFPPGVKLFLTSPSLSDFRMRPFNTVCIFLIFPTLICPLMRLPLNLKLSPNNLYYSSSSSITVLAKKCGLLSSHFIHCKATLPLRFEKLHLTIIHSVSLPLFLSFFFFFKENYLMTFHKIITSTVIFWGFFLVIKILFFLAYLLTLGLKIIK